MPISGVDDLTPTSGNQLPLLMGPSSGIVVENWQNTAIEPTHPLASGSPAFQGALPSKAAVIGLQGANFAQNIIADLETYASRTRCPPGTKKILRTRLQTGR